MIEDSFKSIIPQYRRNEEGVIISQPIHERIEVPLNKSYITSEIIDEYYRVVIKDLSGVSLTEVFNYDDISSGKYYVNYKSRKIYFDETLIGIEYDIYYNGLGGEFINSSLIATQTDMSGDVVQTLEDIFSSGSIGNVNESWGKAVYIEPSDNILQLTYNRRQYVGMNTLNYMTTVVKLPTVQAGDFLQISLMLYSDIDSSIIFEDESIKWINKPIIQSGRSYVYDFKYINGSWYCRWFKYERYMRDYLYKEGDTCNLLTGGYDDSISDESDLHLGYAKVSNRNEKLVFSYSFLEKFTTENVGEMFIPRIQTNNLIDFTQYSKLYIDYELFQNSYYYSGESFNIYIGDNNIYTSSLLGRNIISVNIEDINDISKLLLSTSLLRTTQRTAHGTCAEVYNIWLEKNEGFVDTTDEIFTPIEKNKLAGISTDANKVIDSTINGNILIDGVETNVYTHPSGTNPHNTTKADIGLSDVDNTSDLNKPISNATQSALNLKINTSQKGVANGVAQLDDNGIIPSSQLPSYVDDILEYTSNSLFPTTGESGKIYLNTTNNLTYRWTGSGYVEISPSIALGETSSTAYAGDKGKTTTDNVNGHLADTVSHITSTERTNWNGKATQDDIDESINNIQVGGVNLFKGTDDFNSSYWDSATELETYENNTDYKQATITSTYGQIKTTMVKQGFDFSDTTKTWTISAMFKASNTGQTIGIITSSNRVLWEQKNLSTTWTKLIWTFSGDGYGLTNFTFGNANLVGSVKVAQIKVEEGTKNTTWNLAIEDTNNKINLLKQSGGTRPTTDIFIGMMFFDTTLNKPIWCKSISPIVWVDSTGTVV